SLLMLVPLLTTLAACGVTNSGGKIQLTLWYWDRSIDDNLIAQVGKVFPNIQLNAQKISDYDNKVRTAMAGHNGVPDILGINSNVATYYPDEDQFYDLRTLGANDVQSQYLPWKWQLGVAPDGKMIAFPMDTGPTALFYRADIFAQAGLPTDPQQVSAQIKTWDDYLQAAQKVKTATNGKSFLIDNITTVYNQMMAQSARQYFDKSGKYIGDQAYMKQIWDEAVKAHQMDVTAKVPMWTTEWNQAVSQGLIASFVGAVWMKQILEEAAPDTKGKWRIAYAPGGAGNNGGSFLAISKYCQYPKEAFEVVKWLQSPQNQLTGYNELQLYPSTPATFDNQSMYKPEAFFGNEDTTPIFSTIVKQVPIFGVSPDDGAAGTGFSDQLSLMEFQNKNPDQAWKDAQAESQRLLTLQ